MTVTAADTGLFAAAEAQKNTENGNEKEAKNAQNPGESPAGGNDTGITAFGAAIHTGGIVNPGLHRNGNRRNRLYSGFGRKLTAAANTQTVFGIGSYLYITVFTAHGHSSF